MEANQIFQDLQETQFLQQFSATQKIIFVGEEQTIDYLKNFFITKNNNQSNCYYIWRQTFPQELFISAQELDNYHAIVIASIKNEHTIFEIVKHKIDDLKLKIPVLRLFSDLFVNLMSEQKLLQSSDTQIKLPQTSYAIITTPRSGSNFLCSILKSTHIAGYPKEHLRQPSLVLAQHCGFDYLRLLQILMTYQITPNQVFGTKLISHFVKDFQQTQFDFEKLFHLIPKFIYLIRKDKIAQAVSVVLAQKTNVWHIDNYNKYHNYQTQLETIEIDDTLLQKIHRTSQSLQQGEIYLNKLFKTYQISPLVIEYEQLLVNKEQQVEKILAYLNISYLPTHLSNLQSTYKKTGSNFSEQIINQYKNKYLSSHI